MARSQRLAEEAGPTPDAHMIRLKDIAAKAGVSIMTVSKVMRNAKDVSTATRVRVHRIASDMGYVPNSMAQSMRTRSTKLLGLVIPSITNPIFGRVVMAIEDRSQELGFDVILTLTGNQIERELNAIHRMVSRRVEGLIIAPVHRMDPVAQAYEELVRQSISTVILGQKSPFCAAFPNVESDDQAASQAATEYLLSLGHRQIAFLAGPTSSPQATDRLNGYKRALRDAGIEMDDRLVFNAGGTVEEGEAVALQMLNERAQFTAIQAVNDLVAIGAANTFLKQGLSIPRDFSLMGFGNSLISEHFRIPLTTVRQPKYRLGEAAMELLARSIRGEHPGSKRLPTELAIRESTGPAPFCPPFPTLTEGQEEP